MKRRDQVFLTFSILVVVWLLSRYSIDNDLYWGLLPFAGLALFGLYSLITILCAVISLKDFPQQQRLLKQDIFRAKQFYQRKGIKL